MISAKWGHFLDRPLRPIALKVSLSPNFLTVTGFVISIVAALTIPFYLRAGGILILIGGCLDLLDGVVARVNESTSRFGAFLDSLCDRFADAFILSAVGLFLYRSGDQFHALLAILSVFGAFGVSYARARAEGLGYDCSVGVMERPERIVLIAGGCIFEPLLVPLLWVVFAGSYVTVVQRVYHVRALADKSVAGGGSSQP